MSLKNQPSVFIVVEHFFGGKSHIDSVWSTAQEATRRQTVMYRRPRYGVSVEGRKVRTRHSGE